MECPIRHKQVEEHLVKCGVQRCDLKYVKRRVFRRHGKFHCPRPEEMIHNLLEVYNLMRTIICPETHTPFLKPGHKKILINCMRYEQLGQLSDTPGLCCTHHDAELIALLHRPSCLQSCRPLQDLWHGKAALCWSLHMPW